MPLHVLTAAVPGHDESLALGKSLTVGSLHRADVFDLQPETSSHFWRTTVVNNWARAGGKRPGVAAVLGIAARSVVLMGLMIWTALPMTP